MLKLPKTLKHEPLVDAVFEVRLSGEPLLTDLVPGVLFSKLGPKPTIKNLPASEIPKLVRKSDPNLAFAPTVRLDWDLFSVAIGDRNLVIGCKMPYPKWHVFKSKIIQIVNLVAEIGIESPVERFSLKYVNLIQGSSIQEQLEKINLKLQVGDVEAKREHISVQMHHHEGDILHIMSIMTGARGALQDNKEIFGTIVDIDSIKEAHFSDLICFSQELSTKIDSLRSANKHKFFSCLTSSTINDMEPSYE